MGRLSLSLLLWPALALAGTPKFDTKVAMRVDGADKPFDGSRFDACWHKAGHVHATIGLDDGKVTSVEITQLDDKDANSCLTKALKAFALVDAKGHAVAEMDLDASPRARDLSAKNKKVLDNVLTSNLTTNLSKFSGIQGTGKGTGTGFGTGTGTTGTGTGVRGRGTGGGGIAEGDFVARRDVDKDKSKIVVGPMAQPVAAQDGDLTADDVNRVMRAHHGLFRACYQKELQRDPKLAGKVVLKLTITADGSTTNVSVASTTLKSPAVESCLMRQILRLKFPAKSEAKVEYPFVFSQGG